MTIQFTVDAVVRAFVLTVDSVDGARRRSAASLMTGLGLPFDFVEGVRKGSPELAAVYSPLRNLILMKRSLSDPEIAIYAGHRRIWRRIVDEQAHYALVFEDDAAVADNRALNAAISDLVSHPDNWDIVKFFDFRPKSVVATRRCGDTRLVSYKYPASGAVAYLIKLDAARKLLTRERIFRPVDEDFSHPWEFGLRVWSTAPNLVREISSELGGSLAEAERFRAKRRSLRSLWGNFLQASKFVRARFYSHRLRALATASGLPVRVDDTWGAGTTVSSSARVEQADEPARQHQASRDNAKGKDRPFGLSA